MVTNTTTFLDTRAELSHVFVHDGETVTIIHHTWTDERDLISTTQSHMSTEQAIELLFQLRMQLAELPCDCAEALDYGHFATCHKA